MPGPRASSHSGPVLAHSDATCAVAHTLDAESGNRAQIVVHVGVVATLRELILSIGNSIGKDQRIGPFFADAQRKSGNPSSATLVCATRANLAERAHASRGNRTTAPVGHRLWGQLPVPPGRLTRTEVFRAEGEDSSVRGDQPVAVPPGVAAMPAMAV